MSYITRDSFHRNAMRYIGIFLLRRNTPISGISEIQWWGRILSCGAWGMGTIQCVALDGGLPVWRGIHTEGCSHIMTLFICLECCSYIIGILPYFERCSIISQWLRNGDRGNFTVADTVSIRTSPACCQISQDFEISCPSWCRCSTWAISLSVPLD